MLKDWSYNNSWQWPKHLPSLFWHCHDFVRPSQQNHCTHWISKPTLRWTLNSSYSNFSCFAIFMLTQRRICNVDASQVPAAAIVWKSCLDICCRSRTNDNSCILWWNCPNLPTLLPTLRWSEFSTKTTAASGGKSQQAFFCNKSHF